MSTSGVDFLITNYRLALVDGHLCTRDSRLRVDDLVTRAEREAIVEELQRRVVPLLVTPVQRDPDPWRHALPGIARMARATALLADWWERGFPVRVVQGASITAADLYNARTLTAPSYLKMELLWLLRDERPAKAHSGIVGAVYSRTGGGCA